MAWYAHHVHCFGGILEDRDRNENGTVAVFESLRRELREELSLEAADLRTVRLRAMVRDCSIQQPELLFETTVALSAAELLGGWQAAESRHEHEDLVVIPRHAAGVARFLEGCGPIAPVAVAALELLEF